MKRLLFIMCALSIALCSCERKAVEDAAVGALRNSVENPSDLSVIKAELDETATDFQTTFHDTIYHVSEAVMTDLSSQTYDVTVDEMRIVRVTVPESRLVRIEYELGGNRRMAYCRVVEADGKHIAYIYASADGYRNIGCATNHRVWGTTKRELISKEMMSERFEGIGGYIALSCLDEYPDGFDWAVKKGSRLHDYMTAYCFSKELIK